MSAHAFRTTSCGRYRQSRSDSWESNLTDPLEKPGPDTRLHPFRERGIRWWGLLGWPSVAGLLALLAYAPLYLPELAGESLTATLPIPDAQDAERFFFEPHQSAPLLVLMIAGWLAWRRLPRLREQTARPAPVAATVALVLTLAIGIWAHLVAATDLLVLSLIAAGAALALGLRGWAGCRVLALPLLVLLFALPIPGRLQNEIIWHLQLWSAQSAHLLLDAIGIDVVREGLLLKRGTSGFLVIETCSGFRSAHILLLVAIVIRDLVELRRGWFILFLATPVVALSLNALRIAWIVWGAENDATAEEHVGQGLTVLIGGSLLLFGLALALARWTRATVLPTAPDDHRGAALLRIPRRLGQALAGVFALLALASWTIEPWPRPRLAVPALDTLFRDRPPWQGEKLVTDRIFIGSVGLGSILHRRMEHPAIRAAPLAGIRAQPASTVEIFVGFESFNHPRWSPFSDLLLLPARDWGLHSRERRQDWRLFRAIDEAIVGRGEQRALVRAWRVGDAGWLRESLRSLLALERGPFARDRARAVVRLVTVFDEHDPHGLVLARKRLDRFAIDFRDQFDRIDF